jgi:hypothetical protein
MSAATALNVNISKPPVRRQNRRDNVTITKSRQGNKAAFCYDNFLMIHSDSVMFSDCAVLTQADFCACVQRNITWLVAASVPR